MELRSRPPQTLDVEEQGRLWFFVSPSSPKIEELRREHGPVCLAYADAGKHDRVSISGRGEIVQQPLPHAEAVVALGESFPRGLDDPDLALLCVQIESAEYRSAPGSAVRRL